MPSRISVIIPAFNEEKSIGLVLDALPQSLIHEIIVVDNNSTDNTARSAIEKGARVVAEQLCYRNRVMATNWPCF